MIDTSDVNITTGEQPKLPINLTQKDRDSSNQNLK